MKLVASVTPQKVYLKRWDPEGDTWVSIKPARMGDTMARSGAMPPLELLVDEEGRNVQRLRLADSQRRLLECWLTFDSASIMEEDENGNPRPMFTKGMARAEFEAAFKRLPIELAEEWHEAVLQVNPQWDELGLVNEKN